MITGTGESGVDTAAAPLVAVLLPVWNAAATLPAGVVYRDRQGTLERFTGDGLMVFFNDPLPCPDPAARAVRMAVGMRQRMRELTETWRKSMHQLDFGVGIAQGYATVGMIGFESRVDYAAIGSVTNLAARLCAEAGGGQILISQRVFAAVEELVHAEILGEHAFKGSRALPVFNVVGLKDSEAHR